MHAGGAGGPAVMAPTNPVYCRYFFVVRSLKNNFLFYWKPCRGWLYRGGGPTALGSATSVPMFSLNIFCRLDDKKMSVLLEIGRCTGGEQPLLQFHPMLSGTFVFVNYMQKYP